MGASTDSLLADLASLVNEELKIVSYKWLARQYALPSNYAKQVLFKFAEQQGPKVKAVYAVAGVLKGDAAAHVVRLVDAAELSAATSELAVATSIHVHRCAGAWAAAATPSTPRATPRAAAADALRVPPPLPLCCAACCLRSQTPSPTRRGCAQRTRCRHASFTAAS